MFGVRSGLRASDLWGIWVDYPIDKATTDHKKIIFRTDNETFHFQTCRTYAEGYAEGGKSEKYNFIIEKKKKDAFLFSVFL